MCSMNDDPSTYDEPIEDSIDWVWLRQRRIADQSAATERERTNGIPERPGTIEREYDRMRHSQARRGAEYVERDWMAERRRRIEETGE